MMELVEPCYPKNSAKGCRPLYPLGSLLRSHLQQQWYPLCDPAIEDELKEVPTMRRFAEIDLFSDRIQMILRYLNPSQAEEAQPRRADFSSGESPS